MLISPRGSAGELTVVLPMPESGLYVSECGSCHTAYAPTYLPTRSWHKMMQELGSHFGEDVSLPKAERNLLSAQLEALAGDSLRAVATIASRNAALPETVAPQRVTTTPFFAFMHDEVPGSIWQRRKVGSKSNCVACHGRADEGRYFEREIQIPR